MYNFQAPLEVYRARKKIMTSCYQVKSEGEGKRGNVSLTEAKNNIFFIMQFLDIF